jgi:hypothetical protein
VLERGLAAQPLAVTASRSLECSPRCSRVGVVDELFVAYAPVRLRTIGLLKDDDFLFVRYAVGT